MCYKMLKISACWFSVLLCVPAIFCEEYILAERKPTDNDNWWSNTIMYQVYPLSFQDSNNDGYGDIKGIIRRLDHFVDLGIETLWIGPLFKTPMEDMGYDVEDYRMIDPIFGTMEDFDELISEMNKRNLKLITDIIPNHSSSACEWFRKSIKRDEKYDNYYIWRDAKNQKQVIENSSVTPIEPNNWVSRFSGIPAWLWNDERKQFYFHAFNPKQPDFNMRNPSVKQEILDIMEFWLDKGVAGFRFDAVQFLYESETLLDEPVIGYKTYGPKLVLELDHIYTIDQPEDIEIVLEWRTFMDNYSKRKNTYQRILSTESYTDYSVLKQYYGNSSRPGAQIPFNFGFIQFADNDNVIESIDRVVRDWIEITPPDGCPNWVLENHDRPRLSFTYGPEMVSIFTALKLSLPGVEVTYYGSEIGMVNAHLRSDQIIDTNIALVVGGEHRDAERTPMQWDSSRHAGFTQAEKPWLPVNPNYYKLNVETQRRIPTSNYNFYKKMSQLRKTNTLKYGSLQTYIVSKSIYVLKRSLSEHESYFVVMNVGSEINTVVLSNVISNVKHQLYVCLGSENSAYTEGNIVSTNTAVGSPLRLRPQSVVVLTDKTVEPQTNGCSRIAWKSTSSLCAILLLTLYFK